jgi:hypothetical protein
MVFAADKCGPGAYNLPLYLAFADPMYCAGLMLPPMIKGFRFHVIDMDQTAGDSVIELDAPADGYHIAALLRDNERFGIDRIVSRTYGEVAIAVSAQRLHSIAGKYTGKDDPVAIVRNQGIFPAPEEIISPFAKAHFVGGDARGSHVMPLMPVPLNTPVTGMYCLPIVSCAGFSIDKEAQSYRDAQPGLVWRRDAALFRAGVWRLPRHRIRTAEAFSAARGAQAGSGRVETAHNEKLGVTGDRVTDDSAFNRQHDCTTASCLICLRNAVASRTFAYRRRVEVKREGVLELFEMPWPSGGHSMTHRWSLWRRRQCRSGSMP